MDGLIPVCLFLNSLFVKVSGGKFNFLRINDADFMPLIYVVYIANKFAFTNKICAHYVLIHEHISGEDAHLFKHSALLLLSNNENSAQKL